MEEQVMQVVGKVAGVAGLALGVFLLLFREVIRKNIFPTLSDDEAYRLIRQFMYLTFTIALIGIAAWTYISIQTGSATQSTIKRIVPSGNIAGVWKGDVKYSWGDTYHETFTFEVNGHDVSGVATYVTGPTPISEGIIEGSELSFQTVSFTEVDSKRYREKHHYKGKISGDQIDFTLQTDSQYNAPLPSKFTAHR